MILLFLPTGIHSKLGWVSRSAEELVPGSPQVSLLLIPDWSGELGGSTLPTTETPTASLVRPPTHPAVVTCHPRDSGRQPLALSVAAAAILRPARMHSFLNKPLLHIIATED